MRHKPSTDFLAELHRASVRPFLPVLTIPVHFHAACFECPLSVLDAPLTATVAWFMNPLSGTQNASSPSSETLSRTSCSAEVPRAQVPYCPTHAIGSTGRIIFGGLGSGRERSESKVREGAGSDKVAEMRRTVWLDVTPTRVRTGLEWGAERTKSNVNEGTDREADGDVWRVSVLVAEE